MSGEGAVIGMCGVLLLLVVFYPFTANAAIFLLPTNGSSNGCDLNEACTFIGTIDTNHDAEFNGNFTINSDLSSVDGLVNIYGNELFLPEIQFFNLSGGLIWSVDSTFGIMETPSLRPASTFSTTSDLGTKTNRYRDLWITRNIFFGGTISGGDFNYSLNDANGVQECTGFAEALTSVGSVKTCASFASPALDGDMYGKANQIQIFNGLDSLLYAHDVNFQLAQDINTTSSPQFANLKVTNDQNIGNNLRVDGNITAGQVAVIFAAGTFSCDSTCDTLDGIPNANSNWACVKSQSTLGVLGACTDIVGNRNCVCMD